MRTKNKLILICIFLIILITIYLMKDSPLTTYVLNLRLTKLWAIILCSIALSFGTLHFQTVVHEPLVSPGVLGIEQLFVVMNMLLYNLLNQMNPQLSFVTQLSAMILVSLLIYIPLLNQPKYTKRLLLVGVILTTLFNSVSTFIGVIMDPNEYLVVQSRTIASFARLNQSILILSTVIIMVVVIRLWYKNHVMNTFKLGKDIVINFGVPYQKERKETIVLTIILVSCTTAIVGPLSLIGFMVVSIAYRWINTYQQNQLVVASSLTSMTIMMITLLIVEIVFKNTILVSVLMQMIGSFYFILVFYKEANYD